MQRQGISGSNRIRVNRSASVFLRRMLCGYSLLSGARDEASTEARYLSKY